MASISRFNRAAIAEFNDGITRQINFFIVVMVLSIGSMLLLVTCWVQAWPHLFKTPGNDSSFVSFMKTDRNPMVFATGIDSVKSKDSLEIERTKPIDLLADNMKDVQKDVQNVALNDRSEIKTVNGVIRHGDTVSTLLNNYLPLTKIYDLCRDSKASYSLKQIKIGQPYTIHVQDNTLIEFDYEIDSERRLLVQRDGERFSIEILPFDHDITTEVISFKISSSLFEAVTNIGESPELAKRLEKIFAWDLDFMRDVRDGDKFSILVEKMFRNGESEGYGQIFAALFTNQGTTYKAFLHKSASGSSAYYDENGNSLQKSFLRAPLEFSRISSRFSKSRLHPIFKTYRPHSGVDYAAPLGTPIHSVGDGVVVDRGYNKGLGNYVVIHHPNGYETSYNHMVHYAKGIRKKVNVLQNEVIGYVGKTGYATGYHLDFRMKVNGVFVDPLTVKSPSADPVSFREMVAFMADAAKFSMRIEQVEAAENKELLLGEICSTASKISEDSKQL